MSQSKVHNNHLSKRCDCDNSSGKLKVVAYLMFKDNLPSKIMDNIFFFKTLPYSLRNTTALHCRSTKTVLYGSEIISSLGPKIGAILPPNLRNIKSPHEFKKKI